MLPIPRCLWYPLTPRFGTVDRSTNEGVLLGILEVSKHFCRDIQVDHAPELERDVASGLVTLLGRFMFLYDQAKDDDDRSRRFRSSGVQYIASLSTSLTMVLHCSSSILSNCVKEFHTDLAPTLTKMAEHFSSNDQQDAVLLQVILANTSRTIHLISPHLQEHTEEFIDTLLLMLRGGSASSPVKVDICDTLCNLVKSAGPLRRDEIISKVELHATPLISLLSTNSCHSYSNRRDKLALGLHDLAELSETIQTKMMKRRCTVLAIVRHFHHPSLEIRRKAYAFCQELVNHAEMSSNRFSNGMYVHLEIVEAGLIEYAVEEKDPDAQLQLATLLHNLITVQAFPSNELMDIVRNLAYSGQSDEGMQKEPFPFADSLSTLVDLTTFPFAQVRSKALQTLEFTLNKTDSACILLDETEMIENFALIVTHGSAVDCDAALNIVRQLSRSSWYHAGLCKNTDFLATIVKFVANDEVVNRKSHLFGVEILLALLSNEDNIEKFLPHRHLLPWLVTFLNKTTADESFKEQVVEAVIRLSTAYLKHD
jgi:hypothetical protein